MGRKDAAMLLILALLLVGAAVLRLACGPEGLAFAASETAANLRWTRVLAAVSVGSALAVAGVMLQSLLRNPLASPDLIGVSAGSGLAVVVSAYLGYLATGQITPPGAEPIPAVIGALATLGFVYTLSQRRGFIEPVTLILVGVVVGILCGSAAAFIRQLLPDGGFAVARLLVGRLSDDLSIGMVWGVLAVTVTGAAIGAWLGPAMDAAAMSDDEARSVGVPVGALRLALFLISGVLTAGSVVLVGPIGFVGLVVPHAVRMLTGPNHRVLMIGSALTGATAVVLADVAVRLIPTRTGAIPIGILTALVGGPVFLWMLYSSIRKPGVMTQ
ncbi:MAG: iron ABC transporter permease [Phycisphaerales bacterium]|nr:iron ABC transporter permease [Phycisphaerales bacterium]MCB9836765.1 iron ABC transporter permease [Phycisphaera sp.]